MYEGLIGVRTLNKSAGSFCLGINNMNLNGRMKKLQTAIVKSGLVVKVNSIQFYSADQKRMITSYRISTPVTYYSERNFLWKQKDYEILKTCSMPEVIFCLLDIYKAVMEWH